MKVFIENEAGSLVKNLHDEKSLKFKGTECVSRPYPFAYGFVANTCAEDGDNVDCFVLSDAELKRGQIIDCEPIALMQQIEDGQIDHKILASTTGREVLITEAVRQSLVEFSTHVFDHIPGKTMQIGNFLDREAALDHLRQHESREDNLPYETAKRY